MIEPTPMLIFVGHISIDNIKNIWGERKQLGGAALYSSLAAKVLIDNVKIISAIGKDFKQLDFLQTNFPDSVIKKMNMPSTSFTITYDEKFRATYNSVDISAGKGIKVSDLPKKWIRKGTYIHIAPIRPAKAQLLIKLIRDTCSETWITMNTSPDYLIKPENRSLIKKLMSDVNLTILNDQEAMILAQTDSLIGAVNSLKAKRLAVTLGQIGAIIIENKKVQMIPALSGLTMTPKDTTGAGDTWCGALLASYAKTGDWTNSVITASLISAIKCLGWGFDKIRKLKFKSPDEIAEHVLSLTQNSGQLTLKEFLN